MRQAFRMFSWDGNARGPVEIVCSSLHSDTGQYCSLKYSSLSVVLPANVLDGVSSMQTRTRHINSIWKSQASETA
jgi:hypothetical protein